MKRILKRLLKPVVTVSIAGVCVAGLGLLIRVTPVYYAGLILASPLYLIYLPLCVIMLIFWMTWPFWVPFYRLAIKRHGAPFNSGDTVRVLRGQHKGEICRVYDVWNERDQVRLELGQKEKEDVTDVFSFLSVQKIEESEQSPPAYPEGRANAPSGSAEA